MGLFKRAKKDETEKPHGTDFPPVQIKTPDEIQRERTANELEYLQGELQSKTDHLNSIAEKLAKVKEEYDQLTGTLMASKKEINENKAEYEKILGEIDASRSELDVIQRQIDQKKETLDEIQRAKSGLEETKSQYLKYKKEIEEIKSAHDSYEQLKKSQETAAKELEEIRKEHEEKKKEIEAAKKELKFIEGQTANAADRAAPKNVVAAASSVVSSLNSKLLATQKEMEMLKIALQREREDHKETKDKLDKLLKK